MKFKKTLSALLTCATLALTGCGKSDHRLYLFPRYYLRDNIEHYATDSASVLISSPARDQSPNAMGLYAIVNSDELREHGFNPDNVLEHDHKQWLKYTTGRDE